MDNISNKTRWESMCAYPQMPTDENKPPTAIKPALCQYLCGQKSKEVKRDTLMDL